jgi:hypothetical protein
MLQADWGVPKDPEIELSVSVALVGGEFVEAHEALQASAAAARKPARWPPPGRGRGSMPARPGCRRTAAGTQCRDCCGRLPESAPRRVSCSPKGVGTRNVPQDSPSPPAWVEQGTMAAKQAREQQATHPTQRCAEPKFEAAQIPPQRPTPWLGISDSNFDVQRENSSL